MKNIIIAIDGYSACGKSTLAKQLAGKLQYLYLDTGAMYRSIALYILQNKVDWKDDSALDNALKKTEINFEHDIFSDTYNTFLNGKNVEGEIRNMEVSNLVSEIAAVSIVRKFLVKQQQLLGRQKKIVMDGRDIGTVVFPDAELKIFVIADMQVRIGRRYKELTDAGFHVTNEEIHKNLIKRDHEETTRADSPLKKAADAVVLDTTSLTQEKQLDIALAMALKKIEYSGEM